MGRAAWRRPSKDPLQARDSESSVPPQRAAPHACHIPPYAPAPVCLLTAVVRVPVSVKHGSTKKGPHISTTHFRRTRPLSHTHTYLIPPCGYDILSL